MKPVPRYLPKPPAKAAAPAKPGRRWVRILRRVGGTLVVLAAVGVGVFWWFAYSPFEGKVDRLDALVPADVDFVYQTSWVELERSGWLQRNLRDDPVVPSLAPAAVVVGEGGRTLQQELDRIPEIEAQINDGVPAILHVLQGLVFGSKEFGVVKDVFPAEIVQAGRWCGGGNPSEGPPTWREALYLTRVSPLMKFVFEALRHDFVRERAVPANEISVEATLGGLLRIELKGARPPRRRVTCEGGFEVAPQNVWWVGRVKDVLAISNSEDLAKRTMDVARGSEDRAIDRPGFDVTRPEGGLSAAVDLVGLRSYLNRYFSAGDESQRIGSFLGKFVAIDALDRASATVTPLADGAVARADIAYSDDRLRNFKDVLATYELAPISVADGIARLLPAKDTAIVAQLKTPPRALLHALFESFGKSDQKLIEDNLQEIGVRRRKEGQPAYANVGEFLDEIGGELGSDTGVAVARISSVFDGVKYADWFSNDDPVPTAVLAVMCKIRPGARQEEVDAFLSDRVGAMGFGRPEAVTSPEGITYSRLKLQAKLRDYELVQPAFKVHDGYWILATREDYLLEILKTMRGGPGAPPTVAASTEFTSAMSSLPAEATLAVHVNVANLRALAWDFRNLRVHQLHDDAQHAAAFRGRRHGEISRAGGRVDLKQVDEEIDKEMARYRSEEYPKFIEEYRKGLDEWSRVASFGFLLAADKADSKVVAGVRVLFTPGKTSGE